MSSSNNQFEVVKTGVFWGLALVLLVIAFLTYPRVAEVSINEQRGKLLIDEKKITSESTYGFEILSYDPKTGLKEFNLEKDAKGRWSIPSHSNYPADAEAQVSAVLSSLSGLTIVEVIPGEESAYKDYGLLQPDKNQAAAGLEGVGTLVTVRDKNRQELTKLIIGKEEADNKELRFVRLADQPNIFVVKYDPTILKTDFGDWIEKDALLVSASDVGSVSIHGVQQVAVSGGIGLRKTFEAILKPDGVNWISEKLVEFGEDGAPKDRVLGPDEELDNTKLQTLARTIDSLQIVDVEKKPEGLGADLKATNQAAIESLQEFGFIPVKIDQKTDIVDVQALYGEMFVDLKSGVRYILRFGGVREAKSGKVDEVERYLMVSTTVNEEMFPMPEKRQLPPEPMNGGNENPPPPPDEKPGPPPTEPAKDDAKKEEEKKDGEAPTPAPVEEKKEEPGSCSGPTQETPAPATQPPADPPIAAPAQPAPQQNPAPQNPAQPQQPTREELQRRLDVEYQQALDLRNANIKRAADKVRELNYRFGEWYYVISDEEFKKLHLSVKDIVKTKEAQPGESPLNLQIPRQ